MQKIDDLDASPKHFLCPISLDIMVDPVILQTGHTYDRKSIQRWFDGGHTTCPITMLELSDFSLTPNRILSRFITQWSEQLRAKQQISDDESLRELLKAAQGYSKHMDKAEMLRELQAAVREQEPTKKAFMQERGSAYACSLLNPDASLNNSLQVLSILADLPLDSTAKSALRDGKTLLWLFNLLHDESLDTRIDAARFLRKLLQSKSANVDSALTSEVFSGLKRLMTENDEHLAMAVGLNLLSTMIMSSSGNRISCFVTAGFVPVLVELVSNCSPECVEMALKSLEMLTATSEGKEALKGCPLSACINSLTAVLLKISEKCTLYALLILLMIFKLKLVEEVANALMLSRLPRKLLLVLQSNCNPALKKRALELLKLLDQARIRTTEAHKVRFETTETLL